MWLESGPLSKPPLPIKAGHNSLYGYRRYARNSAPQGVRPAKDYGKPTLVLVVLEEFFPRNLLIRNIHQLDEEIDDFVLEQRRAQRRQCGGIVAVVVPHLLLAPGHHSRLRDHRLSELVVGHLYIVLLADLR